MPITTLNNGNTIVTGPMGSTVFVSPGEPGPPGPGLELSGIVATYAGLPGGLGTSDAGKAYLNQADGKVYVWSGTAFPASGSGTAIAGPAGATGVGISGISLVGSDTLRFAKTDTSNTDVVVPAITAAAASATAAASSATAASTSASGASSSATSASSSASAASTSASAASTSATNAAASATSATGSASAANTSATNASTSATSAATSASAASASSSSATGSASTASGSASAASTSASAAATSASNSATSASASASSASDSAASAAAAYTSEVNAASIVSSGLPNATSTITGGVKLPGGVDGELGGTYDHPTVTGWANKADLVSGKIPTSQIPSAATNERYVVASTAARTALTTTQVQPGDIAVQTGNPGRGTYILNATDPSVDANWVLMVSPTDAVTSVNGYSGIVVLAKADVALGNVDNTSDVNKPVSTATSTALSGKVPTTRLVSSGTGLTGGGDLSTDRTLAVTYGTTAGTAAQGNDSRITGAAPLASPTFTGTVTLPAGVTGAGVATAATASTLALRDANGNLTANNIQQGFSTQATAGATTTLTVASAELQVFTGTLAQNVKMPDVTTLVQGQDWTILNASTGTLTIQSSGLNTITTVPSGQRVSVICVLTSGTTAASWYAVPPSAVASRLISAGTGLTGGGDLSADRTLTVAYGSTSTTACVGNDSRLSDTRTPSANTVPADFMYVGTSPATARAVGTGDWTVGMYVGRAFTATKFVYQFETADASGSTTVEVRKNGTAVTGSSTAVTATNQADGTATDTARTAGSLSSNNSFAVGDRILPAITAIGTTPGKGLKVYVFGTWN